MKLKYGVLRLNISRKKERYCTLLFIVGLIAIAAFAVWKARFGFGGEDEAFYLSVPYRMFKGEKLFVNEWHGSQLSAFILYPIFKVYMLLFKTTEGIILNFRYIYIFVNAAVSAVVYSRLRQFGVPGAVAVLTYFIFVPFNLSSLSYNSVGLMCVLLSATLVGTNYKKSKSVSFFAGISFALAVLCQPLLIVFFVLGSAMLIAFSVIKKKRWIRGYMFFLAGCVAAAIPVIVYLLREVGVQRLVESIGYIMSDPEHGQGTLASLKSFAMSYLHYRFIDGFAVGIPVLAGLNCLLNKKGKDSSIVLILSFALAIYLSVKLSTLDHNKYINYLFVPLTGMGFVAIFNVRDRKILRLYAVTAVFSVAHFFSFITSNQYSTIMSTALIPIATASVIVCWEAVFENKKGMNRVPGTAAKVLLVLAIALNFSALVHFRYNYVFNMRTRTQTNLHENGCYRGVYSSLYEHGVIDDGIKDFREQGLADKDNVLIYSNRTCFALECSGTLSQYSAWLSGMNSSSESRLKAYYRANPDKRPKYVYICKDEAAFWNYDVPSWASARGYTVNETDFSYVIVM